MPSPALSKRKLPSGPVSVRPMGFMPPSPSAVRRTVTPLAGKPVVLLMTVPSTAKAGRDAARNNANVAAAFPGTRGRVK